MDRDEMLRKLDELLAEGKITEETYREIRERWERPGGVEEGAPAGEKEEHEETSGDMLPDDLGERIAAEVMKHIGVVREGDRVSVIGSGEVPGDVREKELKVAGSARVMGDLDVEAAEVAGALKVEGSLRAEKLKVAGSLKCVGGVEVETAKVAGSVASGGPFSAEHLSLAGALKCPSLKFETANIAGSVRCNEMKGETLRWKLNGTSEVRRISAESIDIRVKGRIFSRGELRAGEITGEKIYLNGVRADVVRGENVEIGPRCVIGLVEANKMRISERAKVERKVRT